MLDQPCWVEHQTQIKKQAVPTPHTDDAPGSAPHHLVISEDTSVSDNDVSPDNAFSFDSPILFEPEGDAWVDHGGPNNGLGLDNSEATEPARSEKNVSWDDVVVDKPYSQEIASTPHLHHNPIPSWKKHEQQASAHLYIVPSYSQVPPVGLWCD